MTDLVSITEAARRLTAAGDVIERSTLSRYLAQHSEALPLTVSGKTRLVDFTLLQAHRLENVRLRPGVTLPAASTVSRPMAPASRFPGSQSDGAARKVHAEAEMREMDLAQRRRELTLVSEVDRAGRDAVALMQAAFERASGSFATEASLKYGWDERTLRIVLKAYAARGVDVFHREVLNMLAAMTDKEGVPQPDGDGTA